MEAQPPRRAEQARVRELADRQVDPDLVDGDVEALGEGGDVLRHQGGLLVVEERDPDVAAGHDLGRELPDDLSELHREQGAADAPHDATGTAEHAPELLGRLLVDDLGEGVGDARRDGLGDLAPDRHRRGRPLLARHEARRRGELGDRGDVVQPQCGDLERLRQRGARRRVDALAALASDRDRALRGSREVDAVAAAPDGVLQLPHQPGDEGRVVREPRGARELGRIDVGTAGEEAAQHLLELVVRLPLRIISHAHYANRCPAPGPGTCPSDARSRCAVGEHALP